MGVVAGVEMRAQKAELCMSPHLHASIINQITLEARLPFLL